MEPEGTAARSAETGQTLSANHNADGEVLAASQTVHSESVKPGLDRVLGLILLLLSSPILLIAAIGIRVRIGKPVIYRQMRVGRDGEPFELFKLRTMLTDRRQGTTPYEGQDRRLTHKSPGDPRVLPLGKKLRSWRLDELPQLWNVVNGDMSLVGPRPELPEIVADYEDWQHLRHKVRPGITGLWQISERNGKPMHECTAMDLEYVDNIGIRQDISILARTPGAMVGSKKGY